MYRITILKNSKKLLNIIFSKFYRSMLNSCYSQEHAQKLISELFEQDGDTSNMDWTVIEVSTQIIDEFPVNDPRWTDSLPNGLYFIEILDHLVY